MAWFAESAAANGFGRNWLQDGEARMLYEAGYPVPPSMRVPSNWRLSQMSYFVPPFPPARIGWPRSTPPASG